jgi:putative ATP-binding cassette transporter
MIRKLARDSPLAVFLSWHFISFMGLAIVTSALSGVATVCLFAFTFQTVNGREFYGLSWLPSFAAIALSFLLFRSISNIVTGYITNKAAAEMRVEIANRITTMPLHRMESLGNARLMTALTSDTMAISVVLPRVVQLSTSGATIVGLLTYLGWLSTRGLIFVLLAMCIGVPLYWVLIRHAGRLYRAVATVRDTLQRSLEALILGGKQLRMNSSYSHDFLRRDVWKTESKSQKLLLRLWAATLLATNTAQLIFLILLGVFIAFLSTDTFVQVNERPQLIFVVIYLLGPLEVLIGSAAGLSEVGTMLRRIKDISLVLPNGARESQVPVSRDLITGNKRLTLQGVTYTYPADSKFELGPLDVALSPGEVVFVTGGNGSGKSTFIKLLTGLYSPHQGKILLDDREVEESCRQRFREQFSAIYDDAYIFTRIWNGHRSEVQQAARCLLQTWGLDRVVKLEEDCFS